MQGGGVRSHRGSKDGQSSALEGLPVKFVLAMRTLFDVLDDQKVGLVSLPDIEIWWRKDQEETGGAVPHGVIESLRKVANGDNLLTFERFCAGLKICLLRNSQGNNSSRQETEESNDEDQPRHGRGTQIRRTIPPSPTLSLPGRLDLVSGGPPKPPRQSSSTPQPVSSSRRLGDGLAAASDGEIERREQSGTSRKTPKRRESHSRRHTLQNGIDYGLLKKMKAIEEERDSLMRGLQCVQRADDWYKTQLGQVQERMRSLGKSGGLDPEPVGSAEAARERFLFQSARIDEVNQHLNCLMSADMTFPLTVGEGRAKEVGELERQIERLKEQNKMLTEEVGKKSTSITVLDQEKSALIRELFQARSRVRQAELNEAEATFM